MEATLELGPTGATEAPPAGAGLCFAGVSKRWGARVVLERVPLVLPTGSLTLLAGANGAGKTTLLRIAAGLVAPDTGTVHFAGLDPSRDRRAFQRRLGLLSAGDRGLYARLTAGDHLRLAARLALMASSEIPAAVAGAVARASIQDLLPLRSDRLSMGQRQRLRIALTFLHSPDLVLLDEPLSSLDEDGAAVLRDCIADVLARSGVVLWCSPGSDRDAAPFDRRLWLEGGRVHELT